MAIEKFLHSIIVNSDAIARQWARAVMASDFTTKYKQYSEKELIKKSRSVYDNLEKWLDKDTGLENIEQEYTSLGRQRYQEKFPLSEVLLALHFTKKILWKHIMDTGVLDNAVEIFRAMDFILRIFNFYDLAAFFITRGYQREMCVALSDRGRVPERVLMRHFHLGCRDDEFLSMKKDGKHWIESWNLFKTK